jgi:hypothetical protein
VSYRHPVHAVHAMHHGVVHGGAQAVHEGCTTVHGVLIEEQCTTVHTLVHYADAVHGRGCLETPSTQVLPQIVHRLAIDADKTSSL